MKERLTGAIILVALIVLLVPELLTGPIRASAALTATSAAATAPGARLGPAAAAKAPLRTYTLTLGAPPPAEEPVATSAAEAQPAQSAPQPPTPSQTPATHTQAPPAPQPDRTRLQAGKSPAHRSLREARSSLPHGGWVVQLGSFAGRENADRLARSLRSRGFHVSVSPAHAGARVLWRVRAGPVSDRAHAGRLAARLRALGHRGELLPLQ